MVVVCTFLVTVTTYCYSWLCLFVFVFVEWSYHSTKLIFLGCVYVKVEWMLFVLQILMFCESLIIVFMSSNVRTEACNPKADYDQMEHDECSRCVSWKSCILHWHVLEHSVSIACFRTLYADRAESGTDPDMLLWRNVSVACWNPGCEMSSY